MERSTEGAGPSGVSIFSNAELYPAANLRSKLTEDNLEGMHDKYGIVKNLWHVFAPRKRDRLYHNPSVPSSCGTVATGISEAAFKCGFRLPMLPLLKRLLKDMGIVIGQLDPNSFIHINVFQARCLELKMHPRTFLFWVHYDFRRNSKSHGFYTIARRSNRADWAQTNSNNKGSHEEWFFLSGPKIERFSTWRDVDPTKVVMPSFEGADKQDYKLLCGLDMGKVLLADSRNNDWLFALWGSGNI